MQGKMDKDPTEMISCGKCSSVNSVPFGLDRFKCYSCGTMVAISKEPSAACAAASETARYYDGLHESASTGAGGGSLSSQASAPEARKSESFFGKLQKTMDKTMQKVERAFQAPTSTKPAPPSSREDPMAGMSEEEEQLQWALSASLEKSIHPATGSPTSAGAATRPPPATASAPQFLAIASAPSALGQAPAAAAPTASAGDQLQAAAMQAAQRLQAAEERAKRAEQELEMAKASEAAAAAERDALRRQLTENEQLVSGLTQQLDAVHSQHEERERRCQALEQALLAARQAAAAKPRAVDEDDEAEIAELEEHQGTVAQLLSRIAELEATLMQATHFAPVEEDVAELELVQGASAPAAVAVELSKEEEEEEVKEEEQEGTRDVAEAVVKGEEEAAKLPTFAPPPRGAADGAPPTTSPPAKVEEASQGADAAEVVAEVEDEAQAETAGAAETVAAPAGLAAADEALAAAAATADEAPAAAAAVATVQPVAAAEAEVCEPHDGGSKQ
mmetsp:Transcript_47695/g.135604  ORF Transcript_47695/g.135604 Transcript_47695/m.135604 type:complete len:505 (-) Transcript_47695:44-1558(-)